MYTALYRKWRPQLFEDVCGQEQITVTLKNELKNNKLSHAYLFCGTRGTGKTSTAKLLAKAVNCKNPQDHNPCNRCESCVSINEGNSIDVYEIDAASNRGIDDIRNLREAIKFTPTLGKYKVYIIDEVHMLTNEAFNALLKTLEEPPEYVLFILATTEPHKLPATILSRCQRFDFKRISVEEITGRLQKVCDKEDLAAEESALRLIARNADGAMRDALSILDQCAVYGNKQIAVDTALAVLGIANNEFLFKAADAINKEDAGAAILLVDELAACGKDMNQFIKDMLMHYRNLLMTKVVERCEEIIDMSKEGIELLKKQAAEYSKENIIRCIKLLSELENESKWASNPKILLEIAIVRLCKLGSDESLDGLMARLAKIEDTIAVGGVVVTAAPASHDGSSGSDAAKKEKPVEAKPKASPPARLNDANFLEKWSGFIQELKSKGKIKLRTYLALAKPVKFDAGALVLMFENGDAHCKEAIEAPANKSDIEALAAAFFGTKVKIKCMLEDETLTTDTEEADIVAAAVELVGQDNVEVMEEA